MCKRFWCSLSICPETVVAQQKPPKQNQQHCVLVHTHVCAHQQHHIQDPTTAAATRDQKPGNCSNIMSIICLATHMFVFNNNTTYDPPYKQMCKRDFERFLSTCPETIVAQQKPPKQNQQHCAHTCVCSPTTPQIAQALHGNTSGLPGPLLRSNLKPTPNCNNNSSSTSPRPKTGQLQQHHERHMPCYTHVCVHQQHHI